MRVPTYQSKENISSANAPQAAQYASASAFANGPKSQLPNALQHLADGIAKVNDADYRQNIYERKEQLELDLMRDMQAYQAEASAFQSDYTTNFRGTDARDAEEKATAFHAEKMKTLQEAYGDNPSALNYVESRGGSLAQSSISGMREYSKREHEGYRDSVYEGELTTAKAALADWNTSADQRAAILNDLERKTIGFYGGKGRDPSAKMTALNEFGKRCEEEAIENRLAMLTETDPQAALALLKGMGNGGSGGGGSGVGGSGSGGGGSGGGGSGSGGGGSGGGGSGGGGSGKSGSGALTARFESGSAGSMAIGYDKVGGTSYGKYQIASGPGTMKNFIGWLDNAGHGKAAEVLRAAGPTNTGGKSGAMPEAWKAAVKEGLITDEMQHAFIEETHVRPMLEKLPAGLQDAVESDPRLADALHSTAVQHGPGGAKRLAASAWEKSGGNANAFIEALYEGRKPQFSSSTPAIQAAAVARMDEEKSIALGGGAGAGGADGAGSGGKGGSGAGIGGGVLPPQKALVWQRRAEAAIAQDAKKNAALAMDATYQNLFSGMQGLPQEEQDVLMATAIADVTNPDVRHGLNVMWEKDRKLAVTRQNAVDVDLGKRFEITALEQGMNYAQMLAYLPEMRKQGLSDKGEVILKKRFEDGRDTVTPKNTARTNDLYRMLANGEVSEAKGVSAYAFQHGLTAKQEKEAVEYLEDGGQKGELLRSYNKVDAILKEYRKGEGLKDNPELFDQLKKLVEPGQRITEDYLRKTIAVMLTDGERAGSGFVSTGHGEDRTYGEAVAEGHKDTWLPNVSDEQAFEIRELARQRGEASLTDEDVRWIQRARMGLPVPAGKNIQPGGKKE